MPTTFERFVVPSASIVRSQPSPEMPRFDTSRNTGLNPALIPSSENVSHLKKSSFVASSTARRPATSAFPV